jgi:hypothetical protein
MDIKEQKNFSSCSKDGKIDKQNVKESNEFYERGVLMNTDGRIYVRMKSEQN